MRGITSSFPHHTKCKGRIYVSLSPQSSSTPLATPSTPLGAVRRVMVRKGTPHFPWLHHPPDQLGYTQYQTQGCTPSPRPSSTHYHHSFERVRGESWCSERMGANDLHYDPPTDLCSLATPTERSCCVYHLPLPYQNHRILSP